MPPELLDFEPVFGEPKVEWAGSASTQSSGFLFHVHAPDSSQLKIEVANFRSSTWEAVRTVFQLEDMRDNVGIGGSWSEFVAYLLDSLKSEDVKIVFEGHSKQHDAEHAKLVAQKSKGMPRISFSLTKLVGSAATDANAHLSIELFKAFKRLQYLCVQEQVCSSQLTKVLSAQEEKNKSFQGQLEVCPKRQKSDKADFSAPLMINDQNSPDKQAARDPGPTKVVNRVVPAYRRAKVRGAVLQDDDEDKDN
ncbi:hypothetical protein SLA2020_002580 [Shorea laevis]